MSIIKKNRRLYEYDAWFSDSKGNLAKGITISAFTMEEAEAKAKRFSVHTSAKFQHLTSKGPCDQKK